MFAYTIDFIDIATGWTEQRAVWGKGEAGVLESKHVPESSKHRLKEQLRNLNPFELRNAMKKKLKTIYNLCSESRV